MSQYLDIYYDIHIRDNVGGAGLGLSIGVSGSNDLKK
jgi:hypothetical protein